STIPPLSLHDALPILLTFLKWTTRHHLEQNAAGMRGIIADFGANRGCAPEVGQQCQFVINFRSAHPSQLYAPSRESHRLLFVARSEEHTSELQSPDHL